MDNKKFFIIEQMRKIEPKRNFCFIAIERLKTKKEIRAFMNEYVEWMRQEGETAHVRENAESIAKSNVGYILGYYSDDVQSLWYGTLNDVSHPIFGSGFGRGQEITPEDAFEMGKNWGKNPA